MTSPRRLSVRAKLTLWYMSAMVVVLIVFGGCLLWILQQSASRGLDERLRGDFRWAAEMAEQRPDGTLNWFETSDADDEDLPWLQVWSPGGQLLFRTAAVARNPIDESDLLAWRASDTIEIVKHRIPLRVLSGHSRVGGQPVILQVARSESVIQETMRDLFVTLLWSLPMAVAAAGFGGYWLARHALAPVDRLAERARSITADRLSERLPIEHPNDELGRLTSVVNDMFGRLEGSFAQMRRFTSDVSHEIRTPLTALRSEGEVALREPHDEAAYRSVIGSMLEEADRLTLLVDRLLTLSRAEMGQAPLAREMVDLRELAEQVVSHLSVLAEEKQQTLCVVPGPALRCLADRQVLRQALINVVDNAVKYTPKGGIIEVRLAVSNGEASIAVVDSGPGIAADAAGRVFERFYRGPVPASDERPGVGLGLAIAKWAVEVNGGRLTLESGAGGSTFRMTLASA